jgi:hypothetical protein
LEEEQVTMQETSQKLEGFVEAEEIAKMDRINDQ